MHKNRSGKEPRALVPCSLNVPNEMFWDKGGPDGALPGRERRYEKQAFAADERRMHGACVNRGDAYGGPCAGGR